MPDSSSRYCLVWLLAWLLAANGVGERGCSGGRGRGGAGRRGAPRPEAWFWFRWQLGPTLKVGVQYVLAFQIQTELVTCCLCMYQVGACDWASAVISPNPSLLFSLPMHFAFVAFLLPACFGGKEKGVLVQWQWATGKLWQLRQDDALQNPVFPCSLSLSLPPSPSLCVCLLRLMTAGRGWRNIPKVAENVRQRSPAEVWLRIRLAET